MLKIIIASTNPVKINATLGAFKKMFTEDAFSIEGIEVSSGVSSQPTSNRETLQGALNRVAHARFAKPSADFWCGIEGGIEENNGELEAFSWVAIQSKERCSKSKSGTFFLPNKIPELLATGKTLSDATDQALGQTHVGKKNGLVGCLTNNIIDRTELYIHAVCLALIPFKNKTLYTLE